MLERFNLLENLNPEMLKEVEESCEIKVYKPGETLIQEGDNTTEIYFLISGKVDLYKIEPETGKNLKFKEQSAGDSFGEMSFIDGSPRSCSVEAISDTEVYVLSQEKFLKNAKDAGEIINTFNQNIARQVNDRLRYLSDRYITSLQQQVQQLQERNYYGLVFIGIAALLSLVSMTYTVLDEILSSRPEHYYITLPLLIIPLIYSIAIITKFGMSFEQVGVTTKQLKKSILDGVVFSAIGLLAMIGIAGAIDWMNPDRNVLPPILQSMLELVNFGSIKFWVYWPHSYGQEFVTRGFMLTSIQKFLGKKRNIYAVVLSALFFGAAHTPFGLLAVIVTFVASFILGLIYVRTQNLAGVTIIHYVFGKVLL
ncbi:MAG: cyclic nucleotide-binding domain-containing protein [Spirulina sp.]